jgi:hypothetical protein
VSATVVILSVGAFLAFLILTGRKGKSKVKDTDENGLDG